MDSIYNLEVQNKNLNGKIIAGIERLAIAFRIMLWDQAKKDNISPIQAQVLIFLQYHSSKQSSVSYLAKEFGVTKPTMSDVVKTLEVKKLIKKITDTKDTRSYGIRLTTAGKLKVKELEHFSDPLQKILQTVSEHDKTLLWKNVAHIIYQLHNIHVITMQRMCFTCQHLHTEKETYTCKLLNKVLAEKDIRMDCPEHLQLENELHF